MELPYKFAGVERYYLKYGKVVVLDIFVNKIIPNTIQKVPSSLHTHRWNMKSISFVRGSIIQEEGLW